MCFTALELEMSLPLQNPAAMNDRPLSCPCPMALQTGTKAAELAFCSNATPEPACSAPTHARPPAGLKATFTTAYMHTVIIYIVCLVFAFKVYVPGDLLAGIDQARPALRQ